MTSSEWLIPTLGAAAVAIATSGVLRMRAGDARTRVRHPPPPLMLPNHPEAGWTLAPVHQSPLIVRYREADGELTEGIVHPKSIRGEPVGPARVRPHVVNVYCEASQGMRALRLDRMLSAMDLRTEEFIEDLYNYFGSAQPGGAPARTYGAEKGYPAPSGVASKHSSRAVGPG